MASDLANIMATGQNNLGMMDPEMAALTPQMQLSQMMAQQGLSTAPAYPMQAVARLAQALAGVKIQGDVQQSLTDYTNRTDAELQKIFPAGTQIGNLSRGDSPQGRAMARAAAAKLLVLNNENKPLNPAQTLNAPGLPPPGGGVVAAGSPALAGKVAEAKSRFEPGGDINVTGSNGLSQTIPATAATRAAIQPTLPPPSFANPTGGPPLPAPPQAVGPGGQISGPAPYGYGKATTGRTANNESYQAPSPPSAAPASGNQPDQPTSVADRLAAAGVMGKPLANPAIDPAVAADTKELAADREKAIAGQQDMATVRTIQDFLPKTFTGWSAEKRLEGAQVLEGMGVSHDKVIDWLKTDISSGQILQKKFLELSAAAARTMGAREPGSVIQMFAKAYPSLETAPQAIQLQTNALYMDRLRSQNLATEKTNYLNDSINGVQATGQYRGLKGFNEGFNQNHPAERYLSAAEAMSNVATPWARIKDPQEQQSIIDLVPPGSDFLAPDGRRLTKPKLVKP